MTLVSRTWTAALGIAAGSFALVATGLAGAGPAAAGVGRTASPATGPAAAPTTISGALNSVAITSARNVWAVGCTSHNCFAAATRPLILRWNGTSWKRQASPALGAGSTLFSVAATSARNAWAVGYTGAGRTLILRWNGTSWKRVSSPDPFRGADFLSGVTALSGGSAWAVGYGYPKTGGWRTLILRWNGTSWKQVPSPTPGVPSNLTAVTAVSARSAWAVGSFSADGQSGALSEHWNGTAWKQVTSPSPPEHQLPSSGLSGVAARSASSAWETGFSSGGATLAARWSGTAFHLAPSPAPGSESGLSGVAATSATSAWSVGSYVPTGGGSVRTLALRWNGKSWQQVSSPTPGGYGVLAGVAVHHGTTAWAVGDTCVASCEGQSQSDVPLILHWTGRAWKDVPSPRS